MNIPIILSPAAGRDLEAAANWYEQEARSGARFMAGVEDALDRIGRMPELHAVTYRDVRRARVPKFPYHVYYRITAERIEVLAVVHVRRNPNVWQSRI